VLVIRPEQMEAFRQEEWRAFLREVEAEVRQALAARNDPRAAKPLAAAVEEAVALAQELGLLQRPHFARFARIAIVHEPAPAALAVLDGDGAEDVLLDRLEEAAAER
jgi:hypothetical protein